MAWVAPSRLPVLLTLLLLLAAPLAVAKPGVPYCAGSVAPLATGPTAIDPATCEALTGRVFPEAIADDEYAAQGARGYASDFVSFPEFEAGIRYLDQQYPGKMEIHEVGQSYGLPGMPGGARDTFPIYIIEVTNEASPMPPEDRLEMLFMLSIHGNEKGGREGGMRVIEDLVKGVGIAGETVQNGAGIPGGFRGPSGNPVETYADYLDFMRLFFLFPNVDGWMHDELPYAANDPALCGTLFCRGNGNGTDLNRQMPTIGWQMQNADTGRIAVNEPEAKGYLPWLVDGHDWSYAIDIHGQLNHENFVPVMMPAGSFSPQEMLRSTRLAETLKERLNNDPHFDAYRTLCTPLGVATEPAPADACSEEFADWSTVWDAIGYTDSGFSGDFFAQSTGLNAPGYDIEMSYNHITFDSQYELGALFNDFHVQVVRHVTKSFMDAAALDVQVSYETNGKRTLYLESQYVATNLDDASATPGGWADQNPADEHWQYSEEQPVSARPAKYWEDIKPFLKEDDRPGVLTGTVAAGLSRDLLGRHDTLVIPGSAINQFVAGTAGSNAVAKGTPDDSRLQLVLEWVKGGGNLILTDSALEFFDLSGLTTNSVDVFLGYAGAIELEREHDLNKDVRGEARQTYEPVPLGFEVGIHSPIWGIDRAAFEKLKGDVAGTGYLGENVTLGRVQVGAGQIQFIGALLPDPTEEYYHPYGLDDYATTYSGNQILRNMLGWSQVFVAPPVVITGEGQIVQSSNEQAAPSEEAGTAKEEGEGEPGIPGPAAWTLVVALALAVSVLARRRRA